MQALSRQVKQLETPVNASLVHGTVAESLNAQPTKQSRREDICGRQSRMSAHSVFVVGVDGKPLTPATPAKAKKLLKGGKAKKVWSKFSTFGIRMLVATRTEVPETVIGNDWGSKFDGYSIVVGEENTLNAMLLLPDKKAIVRKLEERRTLRRTRRYRNCRRRPARFDNRLRRNWLAPSQVVLVGSRLKIIRELCRIYPINLAAIEDVRFNHAKHRWGKNFSTVEIGKTKLRKFFEDRGIAVHVYEGWQTEEFRKNYGYRKTKVKSAEKFTAHCSDSLALAVNTTIGQHIEPGPFLVVDDTYRCVRRRLHDTQPAKCGTVLF